MTGEEATNAFKALADTLTAHGCQWILLQVEETVGLGKVTRGKALDFSAEDDSDSEQLAESFVLLRRDERRKTKKQRQRSRKGRPVDIERIEDFSPHERLSLLIRAIQQAFVESFKMEKSTTTGLSRIAPERVSDVRVAFEGADRQRDQVISAMADQLEITESLEKLLNLLHEVVN